MADLKVMFMIMLVSGLLSTMNIWADSLTDIRLSFNDLYMIFLMTGWMFFFMGIYYRQMNTFIFGGGLVVVTLLAIRTQFLISEKQFITSMIPHHSMAVFMSKKLLEKDKRVLNKFAGQIIKTQEEEIKFMKSLE